MSENILTQTPEALRTTFHYHTTSLEFRQANQSAAFIQGDEEEPQTDSINEGLLFHHLLSLIQQPDEAEQVIRQMDSEGLFANNRHRDEVRRLVEHAFKNTKAQQWFAPHWQVMNECTILTTDEHGNVKERRPDRVITDGTQTLVIDYKTGKQSEKHVEQVQNYMRLLRQMGYPQVKGYLWYIRRQDIVEVSESKS